MCFGCNWFIANTSSLLFISLSMVVLYTRTHNPLLLHKIIYTTSFSLQIYTCIPRLRDQSHIPRLLSKGTMANQHKAWMEDRGNNKGNRRELHSAYSNVKVRIGDIDENQHFFCARVSIPPYHPLRALYHSGSDGNKGAGQWLILCSSSEWRWIEFREFFLL